MTLATSSSACNDDDMAIRASYQPGRPCWADPHGASFGVLPFAVPPI